MFFGWRKLHSDVFIIYLAQNLRFIRVEVDYIQGHDARLVEGC